MTKAQKYIKDFTMHCRNVLTFGGNAPWISPENALEAVDIEKKETIKKACKYLEDHLIDFMREYYNLNATTPEFIEKFRKTLEK